MFRPCGGFFWPVACEASSSEAFCCFLQFGVQFVVAAGKLQTSLIGRNLQQLLPRLFRYQVPHVLYVHSRLVLTFRTCCASIEIPLLSLFFCSLFSSPSSLLSLLSSLLCLLFLLFSFCFLCHFLSRCLSHFFSLASVQFDPDPRVQSVMNLVWTSLLPQPLPVRLLAHLSK